MKPVNIALLKTKIVNQIELRRHRDNLDELVKIRTRQLHMTQEATITAMATLAEWRDPETGAHIKRTQNYVRIIAAQMQKKPDYRKILTNDIIDLLYMSAPLHDVGKVSIPDSILLKPGPLDKNEFEKMKLHTVHGRDALAVTECKLGDESFLKIAREIAFGHHERWDGTGYPQGIAGQEIPLSARMMAVADVYDALSSKRVYKDKFDHTVVINIMLEGKGTQFDPEILDSFFGIHEKFLEIASEYADPI
jgi:putative two-component system response regulator